MFTVIVSLATGLAFGMIPALQASRGDVHGVMKRVRGRVAATSPLHCRSTRSLLVVTEVALAVALLIGVGLLLRSLVALRAVDPGFDPQRVLTLRMSSREPRSGGAPSRPATSRRSRSRCAAGDASRNETASIPRRW